VRTTAIPARHIDYAHASMDPYTVKPITIVNLNIEATQALRALTAHAIGGELAVIFDGTVVGIVPIAEPLDQLRIPMLEADEDTMLDVADSLAKAIDASKKR
jgi:preprotein translocase subunit SecD